MAILYQKGREEEHLSLRVHPKLILIAHPKLIYTISKHSVQADIVRTHYGHENSLGYLRLPKHIRQAIAGQLLQGVSFDSVLDKVRDSVGPKLKRLHLW